MGLIVLVAATGLLLPRVVSAPAQVGIGQFYVPIIVVNLSLVFYVARVFRPRNALPDLLGDTWGGPRRVLVDLGVAIALFALVAGLESLAVAGDSGRNAAVSALLPHTVAERLAWVLLALCIGFAEEVVYRGYFQTQLGAFSRRAWVGIALQAALFGIAHLDQGAARALRIGGYGVLFGIVAYQRRSLLPGIVAHVALDLAAGLH